jgi:hypothetical protein
MDGTLLSHRKHIDNGVNMISTTKGSAMMSNVDLTGFAGQWIALDGLKMLAHGNDLKSVYAKLKGVSLSNVLFAKVPGNETMIL